MTKPLSRWAPALALLALLSIAAPASAQEAIDVAIVLDTSGSMEPLVNAARLRLWDIVNDLAMLQPTPQVRVALVTYGNASNDRKLDWVRIETPLTVDLELVSERLFALECAGGSELVASVLKTTLDGLEWGEDSMRLIFLAGNESADQDKKLDFRSVGADALQRDAVVHAIFCGHQNDEAADSWKQLAEFSGGHYSTIDSRARTQIVETPFDEELAKLGESLNRTFVPFGENGAQGRERQATQDSNVQALGLPAAATRAQTKASALYALDWDLVAAVAEGRVELHEIDDGALPEAMLQMTPSEQEIYLEELLAEREALRQRILELGAKRRQHVAAQAEQKGFDDSRTFDGVVRRAIRTQVEKRGLSSERAEND